MYSDFKIEEVKQYFEDKVNSSEQNWTVEMEERYVKN
jgi:hypothetical protein